MAKMGPLNHKPDAYVGWCLEMDDATVHLVEFWLNPISVVPEGVWSTIYGLPSNLHD